MPRAKKIAKTVAKRKKTVPKRKKIVAQQKETPTNHGIVSIPDDEPFSLESSLNNKKHVVRSKTMGKNGRPIYTTETMRKEYKNNKLYVQVKESYERVRLQIRPAEEHDGQTCRNDPEKEEEDE